MLGIASSGLGSFMYLPYTVCGPLQEANRNANVKVPHIFTLAMLHCVWRLELAVHLGPGFRMRRPLKSRDG